MHVFGFEFNFELLLFLIMPDIVPIVYRIQQTRLDILEWLGI